ncbi:MAG: aminodeoxychorismate synthase component I [Gammaproteobacteria bacterium]
MSSPLHTLIEPWHGEQDLLTLHRAYPQRYPHLLESSAQGPHGRFDILFGFAGETLSLAHDGSLSGAAKGAGPGFLAAFDRWWDSLQRSPDPGAEVPFRGGWFLYLGYELAGEIEPRVRELPIKMDFSMPVACATRFPAAVIRDRNIDQTYLVAEPGRIDLLKQMARDLDSLPNRAAQFTPLPLLQRLQEAPPEVYAKGIERILHYIREGDVFQVNLSRLWKAEFDSVPSDATLYRRLREHNPGPFNGLATWPWGSILSSSPERLVRVCERQVETRPIAGTRPRSAQPKEDRSLRRELLLHPKERAEHIMLIDLERNDLGRVCVPGSVTVNELMSVESYAHVHHIVSNVQGTLRQTITPGQVLAAVFPGGTITGCPKVRCMEIIAELEQDRRGPYTGSMGYVNRDGDMDINILIRTMVRSGCDLHLRAGAGIVADSVPERELEETRAKAQGMLSALEQEPAAVRSTG